MPRPGWENLKEYRVYRQVFSFKVSYFVRGPRDYQQKNEEYVGLIHGTSKADASARLQLNLAKALDHLPK